MMAPKRILLSFSLVNDSFAKITGKNCCNSHAVRHQVFRISAHRPPPNLQSLMCFKSILVMCPSRGENPSAR